MTTSVSFVFSRTGRSSSISEGGGKKKCCVILRSDEVKQGSFWEAKEVIFTGCEQNYFFPNWGGSLVNKLYQNSSFTNNQGI